MLAYQACLLGRLLLSVRPTNSFSFLDLHDLMNDTVLHQVQNLLLVKSLPGRLQLSDALVDVELLEVVAVVTIQSQRFQQWHESLEVPDIFET